VVGGGEGEGVLLLEESRSRGPGGKKRVGGKSVHVLLMRPILDQTPGKMQNLGAGSGKRKKPATQGEHVCYSYMPGGVGLEGLSVKGGRGKEQSEKIRGIF